MTAGCKSRKKALAILETIAQDTKGSTHKIALEAVIDWVKINTHDIPESHEERIKLIEKMQNRHCELYCSPERAAKYSKI